MGDHVTILAYDGLGDVTAALGAAEQALREAGLVAGQHAPEASLERCGSLTLRPGPKAAQATGYGDQINDMRTNGVRFIAERYFNAYAIGFAEWFDCPACQSRITSEDDGFSDQINALGHGAVAWCDGDDAASAQCTRCKTASSVLKWRMDDPVYLAEMAVEFWNWPFIDPNPAHRAKWWHVDVLALLDAAVGRPAMVSGHKI